jgi:hypothetical protein
MPNIVNEKKNYNVLEEEIWKIYIFNDIYINYCLINLIIFCDIYNILILF